MERWLDLMRLVTKPEHMILELPISLALDGVVTYVLWRRLIKPWWRRRRRRDTDPGDVPLV